MKRRIPVILSLLGVCAAALSSLMVKADPQPVEHWAAFPKKSLGKQVMVDDNGVRVKADPSVKHSTSCTTPTVPVQGRLRITGEIRIEGLEVDATNGRALVDMRFFDSSGKRVHTEGTTADLVRTSKDQPWTSVRQGFTVPERAVAAKICASVRGAMAGTLSVRDARFQTTAATSPGNGKNVLVVVVDTLRSDMLGAYGQQRPLTPHLDALARDGRLVKKAWTQYTWTTPSFVSYMTSQYARTHGWTYYMGKGAESVQLLDESVPTLAQALGDNGYVTVGYYANPRVRGELGMGRGFESWRQYLDPVAVDLAIDDLRHWADDGAPNFLYVHLMTTHVTLSPSQDALAATGLKPFVPKEGVTYWANSKHRMPSELEHIENFNKAYMASTWDADRYIGRILDALDATGEADDTVVVFFSDHGEMLGEHGLVGHGPEVYEPLTSVPLILRTPGRGSGDISDRVGELVDLAPTVFDYVGLTDAQPERWQGQSLLGRNRRGIAVSERRDQIAFTSDGIFKVVQNRATGAVLGAFDLKADPGEEHSVADAGGRSFAAMVEAAERWREVVPEGENHGATLTLTTQEAADELEALKALGYVE